MKTSLIWIAPIALAAACASGQKAADVGENGGGTGSTSGSASGGGSGTTGGTGSGSSSGSTPLATATVANFTAACASPKAGSAVLRLLNRGEFDQTLADIFPQVKGKWTDTLPSDSVSSFGFDNDSSTTVGNQQAAALLDTAIAIATAVTGTDLASILPCSTSSTSRTCAESFLVQYGKRLFRRPLAQAEHDRYMAFFDASVAKSDFKTALKWMTVGLIQSPNAVYRSEIGTDNGNGTRALSPYEVATELAYTYTRSTPSASLLATADTGNLGDTIALAKSLMAADTSNKALHGFFQGYLGYTNVNAIQRADVTNFSSVTADMVKETETFIDQVIVKNKGGLKDLLTSPNTYPSTQLAMFYGFPAPAGDYSAIARPNGQGIGILAQGSFLATHANATASSPTQRGLFPFSKLLCHVKPSPPPNVPPIPVPAPGKVTTRERYEEQHANPDAGACYGCHSQWDPIGFGFEHFDEGGRYRATESGLTINPAATIPGTNPLISFPDEEGLMQGLASLPVSYECFTGFLATYSFGTADSCLGTSHVADLQAGTMGVADAFAALAAEPHFTQRSTP